MKNHKSDQSSREIWSLPYPSASGTQYKILNEMNRKLLLHFYDPSKENFDWEIAFTDVSQYFVIFLPDITPAHLTAYDKLLEEYVDGDNRHKYSIMIDDGPFLQFTASSASIHKIIPSDD